MGITTQGGGGWLKGVELDRLSDEAYFLRMRACGSQGRIWDDRYVGLLVGADARGLPRRRGFRDVAHMAALQARMSQKKVREVLRIARLIRDCPGLMRLFTRAEVSWTKIRAVAMIARPECDAELCALVRAQTRKDIELWVRARARQLSASSPGATSFRGPIGAQDGEGAPPAGKPRTATSALHHPPGAMAGAVTAAAEHTGASGSRPPVGRGAPGDTVSGGTGAAPARTSDARFELVGTQEERNDTLPPRAVGDAAGTGSGQPGAPSPVDAPPPSGPPPASRAATADTVAMTLVRLGVDPLAVEKLEIDREALGVTHGRRESLAWVLEQAIRAYRPSARAVRLPHQMSVNCCPGCRRAFVDGRFGPLPVDGGDAASLRQSGAAVDLDHELAMRGITRPDELEWPLVPRGDAARCAQDRAEPGAIGGVKAVVAHGDTTRNRPPVPAKDVRFLMALQRGRCAFPRCLVPPSETHHRDFYGRARGHELSKMHLVCRDHHRLLHTAGVENPSDPPALWRIRTVPASPQEGGRREAAERTYRAHLHSHERRDHELARVLAAEDDVPVDELEHHECGGRSARR